MFNINLKKRAVAQLQDAQHRYEVRRTEVVNASESLFTIRRLTSERLVREAEEYVNSLANSPREFDRTFSAYRAEFKVFSDMARELRGEAEKVNLKTGATAAAGIAAGIGTAAFAPSAAMAVATTFGTASTGTAISALSGAAATKAGLAWLGGGAISAGGGGMVAGKALLALAGPVGWTIGGVAFAGGSIYARKRNAEIATEASSARKEFEVHTASLDAALQEVNKLRDLTRQHVKGTEDLLQRLQEEAPSDYREFDTEQKEHIGSLVNHVLSLSKLLNMKVQAG